MLWRTRSIRESILTTLLPNRHSNPTSVRSVDRNGHGQSLTESDVVEDSVRRFVVEGREILLGKFAGKYYALTRGARIAVVPCLKGPLMVELSSASGHFRQFDLKSGEVRGPPPSER